MPRSAAFERPARLALLVCLLLPAAARGQEAPPAPEAAASAVEDRLNPLLEDYRSLAPAPEGFYLEGAAGSVGGLELKLAKGTVFPLKSRAGTVLGFYFQGEGSYRYATEDPLDRQIFPENLRKEGFGDLYADSAASDALQRMVVLFAAPAFESVWDGSKSAGARPLAPDAASAFRSIWKRIGDTDLGFDHLAAQAALNGGTDQYVFAEIEGRKGTVGFLYDRARFDRQALIGFRKEQGIEVRLTERLSDQPLPASDSTPAPVLLADARFDIATPDNRRGTIVSDLTFLVQRDGLRVVPLSLLNNRNPYSWDWQSPKNRLSIRKITDEAGRALPFSHRYNELLVLLAEPAAEGSKLRLRFDTEGEVFTSRLGATNDDYFELYLDNWFPAPMGMVRGSFTFGVKVRARKPYRPVAPGVVVAAREEGESFYLETHSEAPVDDVGIFAGKYQVSEQKFERRTVRVFAYASAPKKAAETLVGLSDYFLSYYEHNLGAYPFQELNVVEIPLYGFGIAPPGMVLITSEAYNPYDDYITRYLSRGINARLAHEIAHQWFPHKAKLPTRRDVWLSESMAEYLSGLAMAVAAQGGKESGNQMQTFRQMFDEWWAEAKYVKDVGPLTASEMIGGDGASRARFSLLYCRGPLVLHMLRTYIGDQSFFTILRRYLDDAEMGFGGTEAFEKAAQAILGSDLKWFVDQWVREGGIPEVEVTTRIETGSDGKLTLIGHASQAAGPGFKKLYIPIVMDYADGRRDAKFLNMDQPVKDFRYTLAEAPKKVTVDPAHNNLVLYK